MLTRLIEDTGRTIEASLAHPDLATVSEALGRRHVAEETDRIVAVLTTGSGMQAPLQQIRDTLAAESTGYVPGAFERCLLLRHALRALPRVGTLPVSDDVKRLFCDEFRYIAAPPARAKFDVARGSFAALCEIATLRRFPAGQFHWTVSGLPRSWVLKVTGRERLQLLYWIARRLRGFGPVFFPHLNANRKNRWLTELESNRSYYRMAESLRHQPAIRGMVASSWLRSPDTLKVSPPLAWMNRTVLDNGGLVVTMGPADPDCGVLARSPERQRLYEAGTFKPTTGLVVWPRAAMLDWASRHPELGAVERHRVSDGATASSAITPTWSDGESAPGSVRANCSVFKTRSWLA